MVVVLGAGEIVGCGMGRGLLAFGILLALSAAAPGCGEEEGGASRATPRTTSVLGWPESGGRKGSLTRVDLLADADRRELTPRLRQALRVPDATLRADAAWAIGRIHNGASAELLLEALGDPAASVRDAASFGLGALGLAAPSTTERALLGALAAETEVPIRAAILRDLGRVGDGESLAALRHALEAEDAQSREAACWSLGALGERDVPIPIAVLEEIAVRMTVDPEEGVKEDCAFALSAIAPPRPPDDEPLTRRLEAAAVEGEPLLRAMAVRALARYPAASVEVLAVRAADADWVVAVRAFRALGKVATAAEYGEVLDQRLNLFFKERSFEGAAIQILVAALEGAEDHRDDPGVRRLLRSAHQRLQTVSRETRSADLSRLHCTAAYLLDLGTGWPTEVLRCGDDAARQAIRQRLQARVVALSPRSVEERVAFLRTLSKKMEPAARPSLYQALGGILHPQSTRLLLAALASKDTALIGIAATALANLAPHWASQPAAAPPDRQLGHALRAGLEALEAVDDLPALVAWLRLVSASEARALREPVRTLTHHHNRAVRDQATQTLRSLGEEPNTERPRPPPNPITPAELAPATTQARLLTSRGEIVFDLLDDKAHVTAARFRALVARGFYNGLTFHNVVPAFIAQGGDPRGDGFGGPGWSQRSELSREPFNAGTVGMALSGPDTAGSQFFITLSRQPHLDGHYTAFARVRDGLDVAIRLQEGDRIESITLVEPQ